MGSPASTNWPGRVHGHAVGYSKNQKAPQFLRDRTTPGRSTSNVHLPAGLHLGRPSQGMGEPRGVARRSGAQPFRTPTFGRLGRLCGPPNRKSAEVIAIHIVEHVRQGDPSLPARGGGQWAHASASRPTRDLIKKKKKKNLLARGANEQEFQIDLARRRIE